MPSPFAARQHPSTRSMRRPLGRVPFGSAAQAAAMLLCWVMLDGPTVHAETPSPTSAALSLERALDAAPAASHHVAAARAQVDAARRRLAIADTHSLPPELTIEGGGRVDFDGSIGPDVTVGLMHTFERGAKVTGRQAEAQAQLAIAEARLAQAQVHARVQVATAWAALQSAAFEGNALRRIAELANALANAVLERAKVGVSTAPEKAAAAIAALQAETQLQAAIVEEEAAADALRVLLGRQQPVVAAGGDEVSVTPKTLAEVIAKAAVAQGLHALRDGQKALHRGLAARLRADGKGNIGLGFTLGLEREEVIAKAVFAMPLGGGSRPEAEAEASQANVALADAVLADAQQALTAEVSRRWQRWTGHTRRAELLQQTAGDLLRQAEAMTRESLEAGRATIVSLITMQQQSADLYLTLANARADALTEGAILVAMTMEPNL